MVSKMPNQKCCEHRDDINLVNCDLTNTYKSCQPSENFCKFAYATWCPVCDLESTRRRSKSECIEPHCRKRIRDKRSKTPEKVDYFEIRNKLDSSRIRKNLCKLPTTYINNCQSIVPSNIDDFVVAKRYANSVEQSICTDRSLVKKNESPTRRAHTKNEEIKNESKNITATQIINNHIDKIRNSSMDLKNQLTKYNGTIKMTEKQSFDTNAIIKEQIIKAVREQQNENNHLKKLLSITEPSLEIQNVLPNHICKNPSQAQNACCPRRHLPTPKSPIKLRINNIKEDGDSRRTPDYNNISLMKEKIYAQYDYPVYTLTTPIPGEVTLESELKRRIRQRTESENTVQVIDEKKVENCTVIPKKARDVSPLEIKRDIRPKSAVKLASIKSRHKLSAMKLRKVRSKIAHSVSSDSNHSDSACSETDEEKCEYVDNILPKDCIENINGSTPISEYVTVAVTNVRNQEKWPIRLSLFPHIPPYIAFALHDSAQFSLPNGGNRYLKWKLSTITPVVVRKTIYNTGFRLVRKSNDWVGTWGKHLKSACFQSLKDSQKLNHFPGTFQIGRKDRLWKNLQKLMFKYGQKEFGFIPRTFVLPHDLKLLKQCWEKTGSEKWIVKPPASARGTGIKVIHQWSHLPKKKPLVVQQYISNPYLINGSKFDLRLYVLVTSFNPLRIYLYPEGLARFASTKYSDDINTLGDRYMHLTNYSINKLSTHYTANEDANACKGHKWTLSKLWEFLQKEGVNTKALWNTLQQLVIKTMLCGESSISQLYKANINSRYNCYELFGVDVLLDQRLKPWLLEVNISPSLHSASPLDLHVKGPLVQSLLNLAQFHLPAKMGRIRNAPPCYNSDIYTTNLTTIERMKQIHFTEFEKREEYLYDILHNLTGDDVRHLTQAEDELTVVGKFERIFPTSRSHYYFQFMETRYYNRLFDAWEHQYENNRRSGIRLLQALCERKVHLVVPLSPVLKPPLLRQIKQESTSAEETVTDESVRQIVPIRPKTSPVHSTVDPTTKSFGNDVRIKMMNLRLGSERPFTPI